MAERKNGPGCAWCDFNRGFRWQQAFYWWLAEGWEGLPMPPDRDASDMQWDAWCAEAGVEFAHQSPEAPPPPESPPPPDQPPPELPPES